MGKAKKVKISKQGEQLSLDKQIEAHRYAKPSIRSKERHRKDEEEDYVASGLSSRILKQARQQNLELEEEEGISHSQRSQNTLKLSEHFDSDEEKDASDDDLDGAYHDDIKVDEEDEKALALFMNPNGKTGRTLADIIQEKLTEKQTELRTELSDAGTLQLEDIDPRVKQMYEGVRDVLAKYRSGKLPKAFKIIPKLKNWEQILYITDPPKWSAATVYQATRVFASNLKDNMAQRFYNLVLLPRVRDDIAEYKRLNFHIFQALRKALFKPGAFMKGILLPLCESGTCTLREAVIIGSVVAQNSIPMLHSAAAILKIAEMDYNGANSIFLRILLDKKYALPYRVVDATLFHFLRFERDERELPVLWHQALLTFVQRYKADISSEQRTAIFSLIRKKSHHSITPEIRRELFNAKCRDEEVGQNAQEAATMDE